MRSSRRRRRGGRWRGGGAVDRGLGPRHAGRQSQQSRVPAVVVVRAAGSEVNRSREPLAPDAVASTCGRRRRAGGRRRIVEAPAVEDDRRLADHARTIHANTAPPVRARRASSSVAGDPVVKTDALDAFPGSSGWYRGVRDLAEDFCLNSRRHRLNYTSCLLRVGRRRFHDRIRYDTIRYIICTEKLTGKLPV